MTTLSISFLVLEILILGLSIFIGFRRGVGRSSVRLAYLLTFGVISFFLGRFLAFKMSGSIIPIVLTMLPADAQAILAAAPELETLVASLTGALIAPLLFAVLFGIFQLLSLIYFKTISGKLVSLAYKKEEAPAFSKWVGAAVGLLCGVAISSALLSPLFAVMYIVENTPDETIAVFAELIDGDDATEGEDDAPEVSVASVTNAMKATVSVLQPKNTAKQLDTAFDMTHLIPWKTALLHALTAYDVSEADDTDLPDEDIIDVETPETDASDNNGHNDKNNKDNNKDNNKNNNKNKNNSKNKSNKKQESASNTLPALFEAAGDAIYAYKQTTKHGGTSMDAATNAAAAIIPYLEQSATIKQVTSDALSAVGQTLQTEGSVMGIELPKSDDQLVKSMVDMLVTTLAETTTETVEDNMKTLFGELDDSLRLEKPSKVEHPVVTEPTEVETPAATEKVTEAPAPETEKVTEAPATETQKVTDPATPAESTTVPGTATDTDKVTETDTATETTAETETETETEKVTETETEKATETEAKDPEKDPNKNGEVNATNGGLLSALGKLDTSDPLGSLKDESTANVLKDAFGHLANNPAMKGLIREIRSYAMSLVKKSGVDILNEDYRPMYEQVCDELSNVLSDCLANGLDTPAEVATELEPLLDELFTRYQFPLESYQISLLAQCAMAEFLSDEYVDGTTVTITVKDMLTFFDFSESEMPYWVD